MLFLRTADTILKSLQGFAFSLRIVSARAVLFQYSNTSYHVSMVSICDGTANQY